jgi:hypothetical protein
MSDFGGSKRWFVSDNYLNSISNGNGLSHEAVCVLNPGDKDAHITMTLYYADRDKMTGYEYAIGAERAVHIRLDEIKSKEGLPIPKDTPYALMLESDVDVIVQYSRLDTSFAPGTLMTTMAYPV